MAGIAFVGCDLLAARDSRAQAGARRREVVVSGRRVKTVDVHAHCAVPEAMALMGLKVEPQTLIMGQDRIRAMDEQGIDVEALSINPYWYKAERDLARQLIKLQNEKLAELCASRPERFVAFATVAKATKRSGRDAHSSASFSFCSLMSVRARSRSALYQ